MDLDDDLRRAWRAESEETRVAVDAGRLAEELRRSRRLAATVFWRDAREIGVALAMVVVWIYLGIRRSSPWTWYLAVPALLWIAGFLLVDRRRQGRRSPEPGESLRRQLEASLARVEHQIWLLRNVFWWYLLPIALAMLAFFGQSAWRERGGGWWTSLAFLEVVAFAGAVLGLVYWLNRHVARTDLEPRRRELAALLAGLGEEPSDTSG